MKRKWWTQLSVSCEGRNYLWVNSFWVNDGSIVFNDTDTSGTSTSQVTACVQTDITETLNDERLSTPSWCCADGAHVVCFVDEVLQTVENTATGSWHTTMDTTLVDRLASDARVSINILVTNSLWVCVCNPGHFTFSGTHVWGWHIDTYTQKQRIQSISIRVLFGYTCVCVEPYLAQWILFSPIPKRSDG